MQVKNFERKVIECAYLYVPNVHSPLSVSQSTRGRTALTMLYCKFLSPLSTIGQFIGFMGTFVPVAVRSHLDGEQSIFDVMKPFLAASFSILVLRICCFVTRWMAMTYNVLLVL